MPELKKLTKLYTDFCDEREWRTLNTPKDLALAIVLEGSEIAELFHWKNEEEQRRTLTTRREELADELADVLGNLLLLADQAGIDLVEAAHHKMMKNRAKYPIEKARGSNKKYTEL